MSERFNLAEYLGSASLSIIAGRPETGRTTMLLQVLDRISRETGREVLFITLCDFEQSVRKRLEMMDIRNDRILIAERVFPTVHCIEMMLKDFSGVAAVGIDYIQLIHWMSDKNFRFLKEVAERNSIHMILLSHFWKGIIYRQEHLDEPFLHLLERTPTARGPVIDYKLFDYVGLLWKRRAVTEPERPEPPAELKVYSKKTDYSEVKIPLIFQADRFQVYMEE